MCAAPGGKAGMIAMALRGRGRLLAIDRSAPRLRKMQRRLRELGLAHLVECRLADATKLRRREGRSESPAQAAARDGADRRRADIAERKRIARLARRPKMRPAEDDARAEDEEEELEALQGPLEEESFDRILLDAPCSGLGQRPQLNLRSLTQTAIDSFIPMQRKLLREAAALLRPGGVLVFCTCSMHPAEDELNVQWALSECPSLRLARQSVFEGRPGALGHRLCQRFGRASDEVDSVAFFIAKFRKRSPDDVEEEPEPEGDCAC